MPNNMFGKWKFVSFWLHNCFVYKVYNVTHSHTYHLWFQHMVSEDFVHIDMSNYEEEWISKLASAWNMIMTHVRIKLEMRLEFIRKTNRDISNKVYFLLKILKIAP